MGAVGCRPRRLAANAIPCSSWKRWRTIRSSCPCGGSAPRTVASAVNLGFYGYAAGTDVDVIDDHGLADVVGSHLQLHARSRPGHEKALPDVWTFARYAAPGAPRPAGITAAEVAAARSVRCRAAACTTSSTAPTDPGASATSPPTWPKRSIRSGSASTRIRSSPARALRTVTVAEQLEATVSTETRTETARAERVAPASGDREPRRWPTNLAIALLRAEPRSVAATWSIVARGFPAERAVRRPGVDRPRGEESVAGPGAPRPYSHFYWHHPGPLYFYVLNGLSTIFGGGTVGLVVGAVAINDAAAAGILVLSLAAGRPVPAGVGGAAAVGLPGRDRPIPFDIWNPSVTLIPFVLVLLLAWSVACRDWWAAPWLALVSVLRGADPRRLAPGVAAAVAFAVAVGVWRVRRPRRRSTNGPDARCVARSLASAAVTVVVWLPPIIDSSRATTGT